MKALGHETALLKGLAENDSAAIERIYKENYGVVQAFILQNNGGYDDARDVFQEAMVVLYEKSSQPNFELTCQIKTYLYSICRRLWLKKLQQQNRYAPNADGYEDLVPVEDEIEQKEKLDEDFALMDHAMKSLGEPCKSLLEAYYIHKKQMAEIADDFGYTNADNAKNQKYKCLMRLKKLFFAQYKNVD
ncbi:MAG TPA: sigma-70 family RNA polymerase sigma factor [Phnomibacter sp.]|nr:sigma-70 family RNA polymerase sigma factor [Phnomibacter sp.]